MSLQRLGLMKENAGRVLADARSVVKREYGTSCAAQYAVEEVTLGK
jgi:hypothetical protein